MPSSTVTPKLFTPLQLGNGGITLSHRIILAPLTRLRNRDHAPTDVVRKYYEQRTTPGGLLLSEGIQISPAAGNYHNISGIYTPEQIKAWRSVTTAVHAKGGFIYAQIWHGGRISHSSILGGQLPLAPSSSTHLSGPFVGLSTSKDPVEFEVPKEMTQDDIDTTVSDFIAAAKAAMEAGFDGVEVHGANGYLIDQFLQDNINVRTDAYGGSIQNRARFLLDIVDGVSAAIGSSRVGVRLSPFTFFQGARDSHPTLHWSYVVAQLEGRRLSYVHMIEPRVSATDDRLESEEAETWERLRQVAREHGVAEEELADYISLKPFRQILKTTPFFSAGGFNEKNAFAPVEEGKADAVVYGRFFISNPDLVRRVREGLPFTKYDRSTFYTYEPEGYIDYKAWDEQQMVEGKA